MVLSQVLGRVEEAEGGALMPMPSPGSRMMTGLLHNRVDILLALGVVASTERRDVLQRQPRTESAGAM